MAGSNVMDYTKHALRACARGALLLSLTACAAYSGHENFKKIMRFEVGKSADDPGAYRNHYRDLLVATKKLPNGNIEEKFALNSRCPVYFEIDPVARKIVGWRYEGTKQDCVIAP